MARQVRNVILIISDTLRRDCVSVYGEPGWFGRPVETPHLARFAERATVFDRAYSSSFPTVPLRNDILTGRATFTYKQWAPLDRDDVTLPEILKDHGIVTGLVVDTPHPFAPGFNYQRGFQSWELIRGQEGDRWKAHPRDPVLPCAPEKLRSPEQAVKQYLRNTAWWRSEADTFVARTMTAAAEWLEHNHRDPFFLYVDTFDPHEPWTPPRHYVERYDPGYEGEEVIYPAYDRSDYLSPEELRHCRALFAGEVTLVDRWIGHLLERAESLGLFEDSAILFLSDHGFYLGEHGYMGKSLITARYQQTIPLLPEVCQIPWMVHMPGQEETRRTEALAQPLDLMPTILDLLDAPVPGFCDGGSLKPLLDEEILNEEKPVREVAIASPTLSAAGMTVPHPTRRASVTDGDWLLVYGPQVDHVTGTETTAMVDSVLRQVRTLEEGPVRPELYHLAVDRSAVSNVIHDHPDVAQTLHSALLRFLEAKHVPEEHLRFYRPLSHA
jgi:arylsulfatase A-like enzyme